MTTKIRGRQIATEDFIENPSPEGDWDSTTRTASKAAIKALAESSSSGNNYGVCSSFQSTQIKEVTIPSVTELYTGLIVTIKFTNKNVQVKPKLKINNLEAVDLMQYGTTRFSTTDETNGWYAGSVLSFVYDGTNFVLAGKTNTNTVNYYTNPSFMNVYGKCTTAETTIDKLVTLPSGGNINLEGNGYLTVRFDNAVPTGATMHVSTGGSLPIYHNGNAIEAGIIEAGDTALFICTNGVANGAFVLISVDKASKTFKGATTSAAGKNGLVPAPTTSDTEKFLKGDGTWRDRIEHITGEVNIWELNDGIYLFDEEFSINATNTQHYSPGEKGYISILQNPIYEYEKDYYAVTARGFMTYGVTSEYIGSINQAMLQTLSGSILEIGRGCLVPGKTNNETYYTLKGSGWTPGIISLLPEQYAYTWDKIQLKRVLRNGPITLFNCSEQYIKDFLLKGGKVIVWSRTESDETYRMYEADNENGTIQEGNVVLRNISYQNGKLVVSEFRAQTSGQTEYWQLTQHEI